MVKKIKSKTDLIEIKKVPERFKNVLNDKKLFFKKIELNETKPPIIEGYTCFGIGDNGFYYIN